MIFPAANDGLESSFAGLKKKKKKPVSFFFFDDLCLLSYWCFDDSVSHIVCILMVRLEFQAH